MTNVLLLDQAGAVAGGQVVAAHLLEHLSELTPAPACAVAAPDGPIHERFDRVPGLVTARPASASDWSGLCLRAARSQDWVVANSPKVLPWALLVRALARVRGRRARVAFVVHSNPSTRWRRVVIGALSRGADAVLPVAVTQWSPRRAALPPLGLRASDVLPGAVLEERLAVRRRVVKAMGRRDRVKGLDVHLDAVRQLAALPGWTFELATVPGLDGDLAHEAELLAQLGAVAHVGARDARWIQPGDVVVVPSRDETACLLAQEAMARGAAVVASAVGDLPLYVQDGVTGLLVPPGDAAALAAALRGLLGMPDGDLAAMCRRAHAAAAQRADLWYDEVARVLTSGTART